MTARTARAVWLAAAVSVLTATAPAGAAGGGLLDPVAIGRAERHIERAIEDGRIPGAVLLIGCSDGVVYRGAFGHRALQPRREPMTERTIFDLASLTKPIATATSVMKLIERGELSPADPVARHIPAFGQNGKSRITIAQLLLHRAGLTPDNHLRDYEDGTVEAMRRIHQLGLRAPPGERFIYSDVGYIVLGELVERVGGRPLDVFAREEVFEPLGMTHTRFNPPPTWRGRIAPTEKQDGGDYLRGRVHDPRAARLGGVAGHAGLFGTADDLARYCRMILRGGELDGRRVLDESTVRLMTRPRYMPDGTDGRTYGFDADSGYSSARGRRFPRGRSFGHTGFTGTMLWIDPEHDWFVIMLTNRLHVGGQSVVPLYRAVSTAAAEAALGPGPDPDVVMSGIDVLVRDRFEELRGRRIGLITNHTGLDRFGRRTIDLLHEADGVELVSLLSPEHGLWGEADERVGHAVEPKTGLRVWSLYGETRRPTDEMLAGIDTLVFDIQDVGARFYTYITTMGYAMEEAARRGLRFIVLDRPNPIAPLGATGPVADEDHLGFIAYRPLPLTHGMTVGELARLFNGEGVLGCDLRIVPMNNWTRSMWWDETALMWVNPSPNMRNPTQAALYPAIGLLEYTNLSVGRGTDEPFERFGAPWIDPSPAAQGHRKLAAALNGAALPGLRFTPIVFTPAASKFAGRACGGVHITITDRAAIEPARAGLTIAWRLKRLFGDAWEHERILPLLADRAAHRAWQQADAPADLPDTWAEELERFRKVREKYLIYRD